MGKIPWGYFLRLISPIICYFLRTAPSPWGEKAFNTGARLNHSADQSGGPFLEIFEILDFQRDYTFRAYLP